MTCEVKIIEDSLNPTNGIRLTTYQLKYWRGIHSEFMTHRVFSRNASSSRAIPIKTFLKQIWNDPAGPIHWGSNNAGMQSKEELTGLKKWFAKSMWSFTGKVVCCLVWLVNTIAKPHKQTFNRMLEPWQYISVIVTSTDWDNFFELRDHSDAQPEIQELARMMKVEYNNSTPIIKRYHLPYINKEELLWKEWDKISDSDKELDVRTLMKISAARCARVSYLTHDGKSPTIENDLRLYEQLVGGVPLHASPTEHQATSIEDSSYIRNFRGWEQHRVVVETDIIKGIK